MHDDEHEIELIQELRKIVERQRERLDLMSEVLLSLGVDPVDLIDAA